MEIQISSKFTSIEIFKTQDGERIVQCPEWPTWKELRNATRKQLSFAQMWELETLFRSESLSREFEVENQVLKIRFVQPQPI